MARAGDVARAELPGSAEQSNLQQLQQWKLLKLLQQLWQPALWEQVLLLALQLLLLNSRVAPVAVVPLLTQTVLRCSHMCRYKKTAGRKTKSEQNLSTEEPLAAQ